MKPGRFRAEKCGLSRKIQTRWDGSAFRALFYRKHCAPGLRLSRYSGGDELDGAWSGRAAEYLR